MFSRCLLLCATLIMPEKFKFKVNIIIIWLSLSKTISSDEDQSETKYSKMFISNNLTTHCVSRSPVIQSFHLHIINFVQLKVMFCFDMWQWRLSFEIFSVCFLFCCLLAWLILGIYDFFSSFSIWMVNTLSICSQWWTINYIESTEENQSELKQ